MLEGLRGVKLLIVCGLDYEVFLGGSGENSLKQLLSPLLQAVNAVAGEGGQRYECDGDY